MNTFELDNPLFGLGLLALLGIGGGACAVYALNEANREVAQAQNKAWNAQCGQYRSQTREIQWQQLCNVLLQQRNQLLARISQQNNHQKPQVRVCTLEEAIAELTLEKEKNTL